jgi:hypothetical protein
MNSTERAAIDDCNNRPMLSSAELSVIAENWSKTAAALEFLDKPIQAAAFRVLALDLKRKLRRA